MKKIKAITFDLWDTVFINDSDEPKRQAAGRLPKYAERRQLVHQFAERHGAITPEIVHSVYDAVDAAFRKVWHEGHVTWTVAERLSLIFQGLGRTLPEAEMNELIRLHENMELEFRPDIVGNFHEAVKSLHGQFRLGVISDTIFSPGRALRQLLSDEGLLEFFDVFIFSDEIGRSKPDPSMFLTACERLGIEPDEFIHIGDREQNDIRGPKNLGASAILCLAVLNRGGSGTQADASFDQYKDLPHIIEQLIGWRERDE